MLEFFLDITNLQIDYSLYVSILLGVSVRFFWSWNIDVKYVESIHASSHLQIQKTTLLIQFQIQTTRNKRLLWITKYIRRKENRDDDSDCAFSLLNTL